MRVFSRILLRLKQRRLSYRLLLYVLACSSFFTLLATAVQLGFDYRQDLATLRANLEFIEQSYLPAITASVYNLDEEQLHIELQGALKLQDVEYLEVREPRGDSDFSMSAGDPDVAQRIVREFPLRCPRASDTVVDCGTFTAVASLRGVHQRLWGRLSVVFATQAVEVFFAAFVILLLIQSLVTRHLAEMGRFTQRLDLNRLDSRLVLRRRQSAQAVPDELEQVVAAINDMQDRMRLDIAERERAARERKALIAELEAKNAELERFTYTVSHDLKSPLITINGFLGRLEQDLATEDAGRVRSDMQRIRGAADTMRQLLDDLLELSRVGRFSGQPSAVDLAELAHEVVGLLAGRIDAERVEVTVSPELPVVRGDRLRLRQVLQNLIDNAVKFRGDASRPQVWVGVRQQGEEQVVFVADNGMGIAARYHEKVFGLFDQLHAASEGTGIGLALVKRIVEVHGGRVWVESAGAGQGSAFCFTLPGQCRTARERDDGN